VRRAWLYYFASNTVRRRCAKCFRSDSVKRWIGEQNENAIRDYLGHAVHAYRGPARLSFIRITNGPTLSTPSRRFSVASNGSLTEMPGSPFPTGGVGATGKSFGSNHILVTPQGFLIAANGGSQTLSVFSVNPVSGRPVQVAGSPFSSGEPIVPFEPDISLAVTPDGKYLITGHHSSGHVNVFAIGSNGALSRTASSPFNIGIGISGMTVTPNGKFLAVAELWR